MSARLIDGPERSVEIDRVMSYLRGSPVDWAKLQRALGRSNLTDCDVADAYAVWTFGGDPPLGEVRPDANPASQWHQELADEWPKIEDLARKMLNEIREVAVGDGVLVRVNPTCWQRPGWTPGGTVVSGT